MFSKEGEVEERRTSAALRKSLRGSPAERRLKLKSAAGTGRLDSFSPQSATPPIGPLRACCELRARSSIVWPELNCQRNLRLRPQPGSLDLLVFSGGSGDCSREQCHDAAFLRSELA